MPGRLARTAGLDPERTGLSWKGTCNSGGQQAGAQGAWLADQTILVCGMAYFLDLFTPETWSPSASMGLL